MPHFRTKTTKAGHTKGTTFGSSAIFELKTRGFPLLPRGMVGFIGFCMNKIYRRVNSLSNMHISFRHGLCKFFSGHVLP